jgi:hypothetical protein
MQLVGQLDDYLVGQLMVHFREAPHSSLIHWGLEIRSQLGKLTLYQLSYARELCSVYQWD